MGTIHSVGSAIKNFKKGDKVVSPFTTCCGNVHPPGEEDCFFCARNQTGRCPQARCFGSDVLDGAQAEYVRVELADSTLYEAPTSVPEECLVLMADIAPTGYFVAENAYKMLNEHERNNETTAVVIGCGPVGLCAVTAAKRFFTKVYALDMIADRLEEAKKHGATDAFNLSEGDIAAKIKELTGGRGADVALEVVGAAPALYTAVSLVRNFGVVSSCGIHTQPVTMQGLDLYNKNLRFQFGRCPVRAVFEVSMAASAGALDRRSQLTVTFFAFFHGSRLSRWSRTTWTCSRSSSSTRCRSSARQRCTSYSTSARCANASSPSDTQLHTSIDGRRVGFC